MNNKIVEELRSGKKKIGIWGAGYIGYSSMVYFAREGVQCLATDVFQKRVDDINKNGKAEIPNMEYWLGFDVKPLVQSQLAKATTEWQELIREEFAVHLITIPTEKEGKPYDDILIDVIKKICEYKKIKMAEPPLVIIESTVTPNRVEEVIIPLIEKMGLSVGEDVLLAVAPRRDWFVSPDKTLKTLPRVVGGTTEFTTNLTAQVLGIICDTVLKATDHNHAIIVKSVENAYRQVEITLANQLSLAYPHLNMVEILKLAGTKWNIGTYHPSFGTGGYCIPLAPQYVLEGAEHPEKLTILKESLKTDFSQPDEVVKKLLNHGFKNVGILGLAYTSDLQVHTLSPTIGIVKGLKAKGISVKVNDPYYSDERIREILNVPSFEFPSGMNEFDVLLIVSPHMAYRFCQTTHIYDNLSKCKLILDNMGVWNKLRFDNIEYHEAGDANWLA